MTRTRYSVLGFDLDGTLVDTAGEIAEAANLALRDLGLACRTPTEVANLIGVGGRQLMRDLVRTTAADATGDGAAADEDLAYHRFAHHYAATVGTSCRAYASAGPALARLRAAGIRLACVTNKEEGFSRSVLAACGMQDAFDLLVAGDTLAVKKPDARVLAHVVAMLGGEPARTAHVGDSRIDVAAARNAGVAAWAVPYGYNRGEPIERARPDRTFGSLGEVADYVLG